MSSLPEEKLLKGKPVAEHVYQRVSNQITFLKSKNVLPKLTVILVGEDPASQVYVRRKGKACEKLGILSETIVMPADTSEKALLASIRDLNADGGSHGILVQLPLPAQIDENRIIRAIDPAKDVDCFHPQNVGLLVSGNPYLLPCTPAGIMEILAYYAIPTSGKHVVVAGRSNIVGKPMVNLLFQKNKNANATVSVVHSRTRNMAALTKQADILIAAIGKPNFFTPEYISEGTVIVDVGINRIPADTDKGYRLVGDVDMDSVGHLVEKITPVPGGVGPMTIAMLMQNTVIAAAAQNNLTLP
jgi:methylenetetrahydrofolate dehydrogenase (NADP+)/methenyltetrahydrofolate cyclohydrolase